MFVLPLAFAAPAVLAALVGLVGLYFLLRVTPPSPGQAIFPPLRLLIGLNPNETTPARTPWPILALRLAIGAIIILAMAEPLWNSFVALSGSGPLLVLIDDGFAAAPDWDKRVDFARERAAAAARSGRIVAVAALSQGAQDIAPLDRSGVEGRLRSLTPVPYAPDRAAALPVRRARFSLTRLHRRPASHLQFTPWIWRGNEIASASSNPGTSAVCQDEMVELRGFEPRCSWQCPRLTAPRARRSVRQQLDSETFVVPERQCDAVAKGVEKVVLAVALNRSGLIGGSNS
jgi:hypothetical protein